MTSETNSHSFRPITKGTDYNTPFKVDGATFVLMPDGGQFLAVARSGDERHEFVVGNVDNRRDFAPAASKAEQLLAAAVGAMDTAEPFQLATWWREAAGAAAFEARLGSMRALAAARN